MNIDNMATAELKHLLKDCRRRNKRIRADTIEQCARVVETYKKWAGFEMIDELAAAIRALKS